MLKGLGDGLRKTNAPDRIIIGTAEVAMETARAFAWSDIPLTTDTAWNDLDYGMWSGQPVSHIHDTASDALGAWLSDPACAPANGESLEMLHARVTSALTRHVHGGTTLVITHAIVVKVALASVLNAPLATVYSMDFEPLSTLVLRRAGAAWRPRFRPSTHA